MGYGNVINVLFDNEGGVVKYFSQCFVQVINLSLDLICEVDGMMLWVVLGEKLYLGQLWLCQIVVNFLILCMMDMLKIKVQDVMLWVVFDMLYYLVFGVSVVNEIVLIGVFDSIVVEIV